MASASPSTRPTPLLAGRSWGAAFILPLREGLSRFLTETI
jgi:hypothetical protein